MMDALTISSTKILANSCRNGAFSSSRALFNNKEIRFLRSHNFLNISLARSVSHQRKAIVSSVSSSLPPESEVAFETVAVLTEPTDEQKTIHVKFHLQKECLFGQHFALVGDDPIFGLWEPSDAIPLVWFEGHIWTAELDIPVGKTYRFKFILKGTTGEVIWQPGPDRSLETWETKNTISILEDWENAELQKITEESMDFSKRESMVNSNMELIVSEDVNYPNEELGSLVNKELIIDQDPTYPKEESMINADKELIVEESMFVSESGTSTKENLTDYKNKRLMVAENILVSNGSAVTGKNTIEGKDDEISDIYGGGPVLVPGLTPLPTLTTTKEESPEELNGNTITGSLIGAGEAKIDNTHELQVKQDTHEDQLLHELPNMNPHVEGTNAWPAEGGVDTVLQNDKEWGLKTLHKFLRDIGFLKNQHG